MNFMGPHIIPRPFSGKIRRFVSLLGLVPFFFCFACKSPPPPEEVVVNAPPPPVPVPRASLVFDHIEAEGMDQFSLIFMAEAENPRQETAALSAGDWRAVFNGVEGVAVLSFSAEAGSLEPGETRSFPVRLDVNPEELIKSAGETNGDCQAFLGVDLVFAYESGDSAPVSVKAAAVFPLIREPEFRIITIAVKKAELINTRFKVKIRLDNPNFFPVELSAFSFELYGGGSFWAEGDERDILTIPQGESAETDFYLTMNFIDMRRSLLDQVISRKQVDYRFAGEATVSTGVAYLPHFRWKFDQSGRSEVVD
jgi:LEA14-like dessication related protein